MSPTVPARTVAHKPPSRPKPNPRRRCEPERSRNEVCRDSELNNLGHAVLEAAKELLRRIDDLTDSNAEDDLGNELEDAGHAAEDMWCLCEITDHAGGTRYTVQLFAEVLESMLVPTAAQAAAILHNNDFSHCATNLRSDRKGKAVRT